MPLSMEREITEEHAKVRAGDPVRVAVIREELSQDEDALLDLSLHWTGVFIDMEAEYFAMLGKTQLELEQGGKASTAAASTAKAMHVPEKNKLAQARYVKKFYGDIWYSRMKKRTF